MVFKVDFNSDGRLLRDYLRTTCRITRGMLIKLKKTEGGIKLNGAPVTVRALLKTGDIIELSDADSPKDENPYVIAGGILPEIIYQDEALMVFNKPSGMPTHTSRGHTESCLANSVCAYFRDKGQPFVFRPVNRLDKDTSGAVMIAKNKYYSAILSRSMWNGEIKKVYLAVTEGEAPKEGKIEGYIKRVDKSIIKRKLCLEREPDSAGSLTYFRTIGTCGGKSLVMVFPITGRTHQIRLHLAYIGLPICGDTLYGSSSECIERQALHAVSLTFPSPIDGRSVKVMAEPPNDIKKLIEKYSLADIPRDCEWASYFMNNFSSETLFEKSVSEASQNFS